MELNAVLLFSFALFTCWPSFSPSNNTAMEQNSRLSPSIERMTTGKSVTWYWSSEIQWGLGFTGYFTTGSAPNSKGHQGTSRREIWHWAGMGRWRAWWQASLTSTAKSMTLLDCTQDVHRWCFHITHHCAGGMYPYFTDHHVFPPSSHPIMNF